MVSIVWKCFCAFLRDQRENKIKTIPADNAEKSTKGIVIINSFSMRVESLIQTLYELIQKPLVNEKLVPEIFFTVEVLDRNSYELKK